MKAEEGETKEINMVNGNSSVKPLTIFCKEKRDQDQGLIKITPQMIVKVPMEFPYKDNKAVPWRYDCNIISAKTFDYQEPSINITGVGHFTHSGRCYGSDEKKNEEKEQDQTRRSKVVEKG